MRLYSWITLAGRTPMFEVLAAGALSPREAERAFDALNAKLPPRIARVLSAGAILSPSPGCTARS